MTRCRDASRGLYWIECDKCPRDSKRGLDHEQLHDELRGDGWVITQTDHLCPKCVEIREEALCP